MAKKALENIFGGESTLTSYNGNGSYEAFPSMDLGGGGGGGGGYTPPVTPNPIYVPPTYSEPILNNIIKIVLSSNTGEVEFLENGIKELTEQKTIDELRDYRFFEPDGVHPNALAIDFVWDKLCESLFDASLGSVFREVLAVRRLESHRFLSAHHEKQQGRAEQVKAMKQKLSAEHSIHW